MEPDLHDSPRRRVEPEVRDWRRHVLEQAGFHQALARLLADDGDGDLHDLLNPLHRGCPARPPTMATSTCTTCSTSSTAVARPSWPPGSWLRSEGPDGEGGIRTLGRG